MRLSKHELTKRRLENKMAKKFNTLDFIMAYEDGSLTFEDVVNGFQHLIDSGIVWTLQGSYGRYAQQLIDNGVCYELDAYQEGK